MRKPLTSSIASSSVGIWSACSDVTAKGKQKRVYRWYATPWEIPRQLPGVAGFHPADLTLDQLAASAKTTSDTVAAATMQQVKRQLFATLQKKT
jgi:hypothetical protein